MELEAVTAAAERDAAEATPGMRGSGEGEEEEDEEAELGVVVAVVVVAGLLAPDE